jgi:hypothetical protein
MGLAAKIVKIGMRNWPGFGQNSPTVDVQVEAHSRDLHPILRGNVFRITGESLRNAFLCGVTWKSGVSSVLVPKFSSRFPLGPQRPHRLLNAVPGYPEKELP